MTQCSYVLRPQRLYLWPCTLHPHSISITEREVEPHLSIVSRGSRSKNVCFKGGELESRKGWGYSRFLQEWNDFQKLLILALVGEKRLLFDHMEKKIKIKFMQKKQKDKILFYVLAQYWSSKPNVGFGQPHNGKKEHLCLYFLISSDIGKAKLRN